MNNQDELELRVRKILLLCSRFKRPIELQVSGNSMLPVLRHGDRITIAPKDKYEVGDIIVFLYKKNDILVHRFLREQNGRILCKGDNSFRIEDILPEQIIGAVILANDPNRTEEFFLASLQMNKLFRKCGYNIDLVKQCSEYWEYKNTYIGDDYLGEDD